MGSKRSGAHTSEENKLSALVAKQVAIPSRRAVVSRVPSTVGRAEEGSHLALRLGERICQLGQQHHSLSCCHCEVMPFLLLRHVQVAEAT